MGDLALGDLALGDLALGDLARISIILSTYLDELDKFSIL